MTETELHISKRLSALMPPPTDEELRQLEENLIRDGRVTDPLLYWHDGKRFVVVDGMHRFEIAKRLEIPYKAEPVETCGKTYEDVELWMLDRQLGRRNLLKPAAVRLLRGDLYNRLKGDVGRPQKELGHDVQGRESIFGINGGDAAAQVAEKAGVCARTVRRDGARAANLACCTQAVQKGINSGAIKATDAEIKTLSKATDVKQVAIANDVRKGQLTVAEAMAKHKAGPKAKVVKKDPKKTAAFHGKAQVDEWKKAVGRWLPIIDEYRAKWPGKPGDKVLAAAKELYESFARWLREIK